MAPKNFRVDRVSNFNDETVAEKTVVDFLTENQAQRIKDILNEDAGEYSHYYHQVRPRHAPLWRGMADLVGD